MGPGFLSESGMMQDHGRRRFRTWVASVVMLAAIGVAASSSRGQSDAERANAPRVLGGASHPQLRMTLPGDWDMTGVSVHNPSQNEKEYRLSIWPKGQIARRFSSDVWLPPDSIREVYLPVRIEKAPEGEPTVMDLETLLLTPDGERQLDERDQMLSLIDRRYRFLVIHSGDGRPEEAVEAERVAKRVRAMLGLSDRMERTSVAHLPRYEARWDGIDVALMSAARPRMDAGQQRALRRWLSGGGTLLVFVDRADGAAMEQVLGRHWGVEVVGRTSRSRLLIGAGPDLRSSSRLDGRHGRLADGGALGRIPQEDEAGARVVLDDPVAMARVVAPGHRTLLEGSGWPLLLMRRVGQGRLFVSTMGGRGWRVESAQPALRSLGQWLLPQAEGVQSQAAAEASRPEAVLRGEAGQRFLASQISAAKVMHSATVAGTMGGVLLVLLVGAGLWWRSGRLEWMAPVGIVAAVLASGLLVAMRQQRQSPPTRASLQLIHAQPGQREVRGRGLLSLYNSQQPPLRLSSESGGLAWPHRMSAGDAFVLSQGDIDRWQWREVDEAAPDLRNVEFQADYRLERAGATQVRLGPNGLSGTVRWPTSEGAEDAVLAAPRANLAVALSEPAPSASQAGGGTAAGGVSGVSVSADGVLPEGEVFDRAVLDQQAQQRGELMRQLLGTTRLTAPSDQLDERAGMLLGWSRSPGPPFETETETEREDHVLWAVPLELERSEPGTKVRIPWPLMRMQPVSQAAYEELGLEPALVYQPSRREWVDSQRGGAFLARFRLPGAVRPLDPTGATVHLDITAVGREVSVLVVRDGQTHEVATFRSPDGPQRVDVPAELLEVDGAGGIVMAFDVSNSAGSGGASMSQLWQPHRFGLELRGVVAESGGE